MCLVVNQGHEQVILFLRSHQLRSRGRKTSEEDVIQEGDKRD